MVSWQTMVSIAFDIAEQKGAEFENIAEGGAFMSDLSEVWSADQDRIKQMTRQQARDYLRQRVQP